MGGLSFANSGNGLDALSFESSATSIHPVAVVYLPLLARVLDAERRLEISIESRDRVMDEIARAEAASHAEQNYIAIRQLVESRYTDQAVAMAGKTPDREDEMSAEVAASLARELEVMRQREMAGVIARQEKYLVTDLPNLLANAELDITSSICHLDQTFLLGAAFGHDGGPLCGA